MGLTRDCAWFVCFWTCLLRCRLAFALAHGLEIRLDTCPKMSGYIAVYVASTGPGVLAQKQYEYCYVSVSGIDNDKCLTYWLTRLRTDLQSELFWQICSYMYLHICWHVLAAWADALMNVCTSNIRTISRCSWINPSKRCWPMCDQLFNMYTSTCENICMYMFSMTGALTDHLHICFCSHISAWYIDKPLGNPQTCGLDCIDMHILPWSGMYILTSFVWRMYWHLVHLGWRFRHKYFAMAYFGRHLAAFAGAFWALDTCATEKKGCGVGSCCVEYTILYWVLQSAHTSITSKQLLTIGLRAVIWLHYARRLSLRNG
jgi:hypothetical protein